VRYVVVLVDCVVLVLDFDFVVVFVLLVGEDDCV